MSSLGLGGNGASGGVSTSDDGRFVAFFSAASNLVPGDTNGVSDVFVRDRQSGTTERDSVSSNGAEANAYSAGSSGLSLSADGRFLVFTSTASNLVVGDTNGFMDVFVRDRQAGTTERVSVSSSGAEGNSGSEGHGSISADGRYVAFFSAASNLVAGDTNARDDVFVHDRTTGVTQRVSVDSSGVQGNGHSGSDGVSLSSDGKFVAFTSSASNLVAGDTNGFDDVFVHDRTSGTTQRVSVDSAGAQAQGHSGGPALSADGRFIAFSSLASNLVVGDTNSTGDAFVHDRIAHITARVSVSSSGAQVTGGSGVAALSGDGRYVVLESSAPDLVPGDTNGRRDVFVRDRQSGTTERVSVATGGAEANGEPIGLCSISLDGQSVAFTSDATNLVPGDANGVMDVFVRDRSCPLASAFFRNAGSNPASYTSNAPVLGASWSGTVDLTTTGHSSAYLYAFAAQTTTTFSQGQVLLGSGQLARFGPVAGPLASFSFAVPNDTALCGLHLTTQALHLGTVQPFATSNAMDLVVGQ